MQLIPKRILRNNSRHLKITCRNHTRRTNHKINPSTCSKSHPRCEKPSPKANPNSCQEPKKSPLQTFPRQKRSSSWGRSTKMTRAIGPATKETANGRNWLQSEANACIVRHDPDSRSLSWRWRAKLNLGTDASRSCMTPARTSTRSTLATNQTTGKQPSLATNALECADYDL